MRTETAIGWRKIEQRITPPSRHASPEDLRKRPNPLNQLRETGEKTVMMPGEVVTLKNILKVEVEDSLVTDKDSNLEELFCELSFKQRKILKQIANGMGTKDVANINNIRPQSVKNHLTRIYKKLEVDNRTGAVNEFYSRISSQTNPRVEK